MPEYRLARSSGCTSSPATPGRAPEAEDEDVAVPPVAAAVIMTMILRILRGPLLAAACTEQSFMFRCACVYTGHLSLFFSVRKVGLGIVTVKIRDIDTTSRPTEHAACQCGHHPDAHRHYRRGSECGICECPRWAPCGGSHVVPALLAGPRSGGTVARFVTRRSRHAFPVAAGDSTIARHLGEHR